MCTWPGAPKTGQLVCTWEASRNLLLRKGPDQAGAGERIRLAAVRGPDLNVEEERGRKMAGIKKVRGGYVPVHSITRKKLKGFGKPRSKKKAIAFARRVRRRIMGR